MAVLSEEREKASEARQRRRTKILFDAKTVFPFCASGTGIVSPLPYAVVDSDTLHNPKEAPVIRTVDPFTGADLCKHRVAGHRGGGPKLYTLHPFTAPVHRLLFHFAGISRVSGSSVLAEFQRLLPAPDLWSMLHCTGNAPVIPVPVATPAPFAFTGCGLRLP